MNKLYFFWIFLILNGCGSDSKKEHDSFSITKKEVMLVNNNPIPKHLYTLPFISKNKN